MRPLKPGEILRNGSHVIAWKPLIGSEGGVVLAVRTEPDLRHCRYVTWCCWEHEDNTITTSWGHYFDDVVDAVIDWRDR